MPTSWAHSGDTGVIVPARALTRLRSDSGVKRLTAAATSAIKATTIWRAAVSTRRSATVTRTTQDHCVHEVAATGAGRSDPRPSMPGEEGLDAATSGADAR